MTALLKKCLVPSDVEPRITSDLKSVISRNMQQHFSDESLRSFMLVASVLDPRFKGLKFLPSSERSRVYSDLLGLATTKAAEQERRMKRQCRLTLHPADLLNFQESGTNSNGSSPVLRQSSQAEEEITAYKAKE